MDILYIGLTAIITLGVIFALVLGIKASRIMKQGRKDRALLKQRVREAFKK